MVLPELLIKNAAHIIKNAKAIIITAGAGMGVDSGLPDFRGPEGFWRAYPPYKNKGLTLPDVANPEWFEKDPEFAWGFYGQRYHLYSSTKPHAGFQILKNWSNNMKNNYFIFTSNVDGQFQKAGFDENRVVECHGSIHFLQSIDGSSNIWSVPDNFNVEIDKDSLKAKPPLPMSPKDEYNKSQLARPNILMFGDYYWNSERTDIQHQRFDSWFHSIKHEPFVVIEIGAGLYVPTVQMQTEKLVELGNHKDTCYIRINPRENKVDGTKNISLPMGTLQALEKIEGYM